MRATTLPASIQDSQPTTESTPTMNATATTDGRQENHPPTDQTRQEIFLFASRSPQRCGAGSGRSRNGGVSPRGGRNGRSPEATGQGGGPWTPSPPSHQYGVSGGVRTTTLTPVWCDGREAVTPVWCDRSRRGGRQ